MTHQLNVKNIRRANAEMQRNLLEKMRPSVFKLYSKPGCNTDSFVGTAWKIHPQALVTCWHVVGDTQEHGILKEARPSGPPRHNMLYAVNQSCQVVVRVLPKAFPVDICFLILANTVVCPHLELSDEFPNSQDFCAVFGFGRGGVIRAETGRVSGYAQSAAEGLITAPSDHYMSGAPVLNLWGGVIGMVTGYVGERVFKTRMLALTPLRQAYNDCA